MKKLKIRIIEKTEKGKIAIEGHVAESFKLKRQERITFKMLGFRQEIVSTNPIILELSINKRISAMVRSDDFVDRMGEALLKNGAVKDIDYVVEVE